MFGQQKSPTEVRLDCRGLLLLFYSIVEHVIIMHVCQKNYKHVIRFGVSLLCDGLFCLLFVYGDPQLSHGTDTLPNVIAGTTHPERLITVLAPYSPQCTD